MEERPVVWRHNMSGVLLGYISASPIPYHIRLRGVRLRNWSGTRIDCSSVAALGTLDADTITEYSVMDVALEGSVEIHETTASHVDGAIKRARKP